LNAFSWTPDKDCGIRQRFVEAGGLRFELAETMPSSGAGDKLAVCLHGFPELNYSWRYQMQLLAEQGWRAAVRWVARNML
jgi:epoxide hydrolase 4